MENSVFYAGIQHHLNDFQWGGGETDHISSLSLPASKSICSLHHWVPLWQQLASEPPGAISSHVPPTPPETALSISALSKEEPQGTALSHFTVVHIFHPGALPRTMTLIEMAAEVPGLRSSSVTCSEYRLLHGWCRPTGSLPAGEKFLFAIKYSPSCPFPSTSSIPSPQTQDQGS